MQDQPKYIPLAAERLFRRRALRPPASRGHRRARPTAGRQGFLHRKKRRSVYVDNLPFPVTRQVLERGQERFNIYCTPCHGRLGNGLGMIVRRGLKRPPSYHIDRLRQVPDRLFLRRHHQRLRRHAGLLRRRCLHATAGPSPPTSASCSSASRPLQRCAAGEPAGVERQAAASPREKKPQE